MSPFMQSLVRKDVVADLVADYGHVVVDECHHLSAVGFEAIARAAKARYVLGLSATVTRKDGHHSIIFMQCGPIRYRVDARKQAASRPFDHKVIFRRTAFRIPRTSLDERPAIQDLYARIARDEARNDLIFDDILKALEAGRSPVVITERKDRASLVSSNTAVLYLGRVVEEGTPEAVLHAPAHPYTRALVSAIPELGGRHDPRMVIGGEIPDPSAPPPGCPFHPRCPIVVPLCREVLPPLKPLSADQSVACHLVHGDAAPRAA